MSQAILWKMVYPEGGEGIPWNEYLHWTEPFLSVTEKWEWKKEIVGAYVFPDENHYEAKILQLKAEGEDISHIHPLIYGETLKERIRTKITPEHCYQMTLRRLGERED